jgi:uncharacterized protein YndB with AHSA1/START domain
MVDDISYESTYPHPPVEVWKALTTREAIRAWLMDNTFQEARVGHRFRFTDKPKKVVGWDGVTECEVVEVVPERRLVLRFGDGTGGFPETRVAWDLEPAAGGTRVRFRHEGFTGFKGWMMRQGMDRGWGRIVQHGLPFVLAAMREGAVPTREATRAAAKQGVRTEHHAARRAQP